jgi:hypothetical protein
MTLEQKINGVVNDLITKAITSDANSSHVYKEAADMLRAALQPTLKFEGVAMVGDTIRAYDFEPIKGRLDSYIEGDVREIVEAVTPFGYKAYHVILTYDSFGRRPRGTSIYVPMETTFDWENRVQKIN